MVTKKKLVLKTKEAVKEKSKIKLVLKTKDKQKDKQKYKLVLKTKKNKSNANTNSNANANANTNSISSSDLITTHKYTKYYPSIIDPNFSQKIAKHNIFKKYKLNINNLKLQKNYMNHLKLIRI